MEDAVQHQRAIIFFLHQKGLSGATILQDLHEVFGDRALSKASVYNWIQDFKSGRESLEDYSRTGRPTTSKSQENINRALDLLHGDRRLTVDDVAESLGISHGAAHQILVEELGMRKICARWVPKLLAAEQRDERVRQCVCLQLLLEDYGEDFWRRIVTVDETWLPYYNPETKAQSKVWVAKGEARPVKAKATPSAGKVMVTVFWDCEGVILVDPLAHGATINADRYVHSLELPQKELRKSRPGKLQSRILLLQDNARPHTAKTTLAAIRQKKWELLPHPPYSPDLAPSDYWLFGPMKDSLRGQRYETEKALMADLRKWIQAQSKDWFAAGLRKLPERWHKCIEEHGGYVEKL
jgi:[histone H3]-lysine36 N-dimethyltransferase SETMAR